MDLLNGTGTHYDKNCWVYREVLWISARSPPEYAGKRLKMAVSKRLADYHRAAGKIPVLYAHARGSYGGRDSTQTQKVRKTSRSSGLSIIYSQTPAFKILAAICTSVSSGYILNSSSIFFISFTEIFNIFAVSSTDFLFSN